MKQYSPKVIDVSARVLVRTLFSLPSASSLSQVERSFEQSQAAPAVLGHSVRSLFALYLEEHKASHSRIVFTAITLRHMVTIAEQMGYEVTSIAIDSQTQQPDLKMLKQQLDDNSSAIVVLTPLFGAVVDYQAAVQLCRSYNAQVVIDCAQGFRGLNHRDYSDYDCLLWSFGPIKTMTALSLGVAFLPNKDGYSAIKQARDALPAASLIKSYKRLLVYVVLRLFSLPLGYGLFVRLIKALGKSPDAVSRNVTKSYASDTDIVAQLRFRPNWLQCQLLLRQLKQYPINRISRRAATARAIATKLGQQRFMGVASDQHSFWLLPYIAEQSAAQHTLLAQHGFHASHQTSSLEVVDGSHPKLQEQFERIIYLSVEADMTCQDVKRLCWAVEKGRHDTK